ncbi:uncharacterized protein LOC133781654 isoform X1 [Humulus lupulus]|uniref:uncharacterized protein LOC133781654 isoform X1 n=1 Tax=Humulus lupulus TaxID=3486 RepID=UPI002B40FAC8|nr:uncharacterized protein LOC133781654 isoform X1 [Humulus lupulus]
MARGGSTAGGGVLGLGSTTQGLGRGLFGFGTLRDTRAMAMERIYLGGKGKAFGENSFSLRCSISLISAAEAEHGDAFRKERSLVQGVEKVINTKHVSCNLKLIAVLLSYILKIFIRAYLSLNYKNIVS